ncbi:MAG: Plasmid stabilization system [Candidatus Giovannonibacteria bacterium GW2011_GWA2_44_13b]|uniref:Plasmid stabilization system n=2 Tax=Candidatus Giovannoniibacteriota TaxID=1752738 RepID=A0A0G1H260_9BACT|nr:MAG: Plasmid stabilization system [Candidatus Giovannonibacteria bacterium GW2011_GWA2_44_13b]OGF83124.1 MAG: hypothetical protein A2924_04065 [Candidatus Giovannonibacteria bacterium RIFCSPLOWO2_01_FULL_44_16]
MPGDYKIFLESRAEKDLGRLEIELRRRVLARLLSLKHNPRPSGAKKLEGSRFAWRIRIGDWRVVYEIYDKVKEIKIYRIKHRREGY